jgi:hypothetical protein
MTQGFSSNAAEETYEPNYRHCEETLVGSNENYHDLLQQHVIMIMRINRKDCVSTALKIFL